MAKAWTPSSTTSCWSAGYSTGMQASSKVCWLSQVSVEDLALGSSPQNMTTPPLDPAPMALACFITSPARSRPGVLPYQAPATPSTSA